MVVKVAVIGAGVFGAVLALDFAADGNVVDLFEARSDILEGATAKCQARLHRGYHYPRSQATAVAAKTAAEVFAGRFPEAVRTTASHHYVVAAESKVSGEEYLKFCGRLGLAYQVVNPIQVHGAQVCVKVPESFVDVGILRWSLRGHLARAGVQLHLNRWVEPDTLTGYDLVVVTTYGQPWARPLRYEVCEVALVELGRYDNLSFVIIDGDHVSVDPHGSAHMFYDVAASVHHHNVGWAPQVPGPYRDLLCRYGPVNTPLSHHEAMRTNAARHLRAVQGGGQGISIYAGSLFSVRAILPDVDTTDERPTLVERDGNVVSVLSGKICTAVTAYEQVMRALTAGVPA